MKLTQLVESRVQGSDIELGFKGKGVELGFGLQQFEFNKRPQSGEEMIGLSDNGLRRRFGQRSILLQRLVIAFDVAVTTHKTIDLVVHTQVYELKRDMGK